ncbi:hypothetical protein E4U53_003408, partial [Claviceps sorghi]
HIVIGYDIRYPISAIRYPLSAQRPSMSTWENGVCPSARLPVWSATGGKGSVPQSGGPGPASMFHPSVRAIKAYQAIKVIKAIKAPGTSRQGLGGGLCWPGRPPATS